MNTKIEEFKIKMAEWLYDLSICFNVEAQPLAEDVITSMVEMIVRVITANQMTFDLDPYRTAIRNIASGKVEIYKINVVNLMKIFSEECERHKQQYRPGKW